MCITPFLIFKASACLYMSRGLFAYSFDRLIPEWFAKVSDRTHSPINALAGSIIVMSGFFVLVIMPESASYVYLFSSVATVAYLFPMVCLGLSAIAIVLRRRQLYESLPIKGWKLAGLGVLAVLFSRLAEYYLMTVSTFGANTPIGLGVQFGAWAVFAIIYLYARLRRGDILKLAFA